MSQARLPSPAPICLERAYPSSQKGGTLIAEKVGDMIEHERRVCNPDSYRPENCPSCRHDTMHVHDYRYRRLRAERGGKSGIRIIRYICAHRDCGATWQILPGFVARWLWRSWAVVEEWGIKAQRSALWPKVPARTVRRWKQRLHSGARMLVQALAASGSQELEQIASGLRLDATRGNLIVAMRTGPAPVAALIHRLVAGVRLM